MIVEKGVKCISPQKKAAHRIAPVAAFRFCVHLAAAFFPVWGTDDLSVSPSTA